MGTQFEWKEEYNIGVDLIDKEHQELFQFINKLYLLTQKNGDGTAAGSRAGERSTFSRSMP